MNFIEVRTHWSLPPIGEATWNLTGWMAGIFKSICELARVRDCDLNEERTPYVGRERERETALLPPAKVQVEQDARCTCAV